MLPTNILTSTPAGGQGLFARLEVWFLVFAALLFAGAVWQYLIAALWRSGGIWTVLAVLAAAGYAAYQLAHLPGGPFRPAGRRLPPGNGAVVARFDGPGFPGLFSFGKEVSRE